MMTNPSVIPTLVATMACVALFSAGLPLEKNLHHSGGIPKARAQTQSTLRSTAVKNCGEGTRGNV